jgi:hypothetical protein
MSEELTLLSTICEEYFGLSDRVAQRKASCGLLPIPAFRLSGTRKGPLYIRKSDLDAHVQRQIEKATQLNSRMKSAGLV